MNRKKENKNRGRQSAGFTLIELMVVVVIIGLLATVVTLNVVKSAERAKQTKARADIETLGGGLAMFHTDNGFYPSTDQGLDALIFEPTSGREAKGWGGPYLTKKQIPPDPWRNEYVYISPGIEDPDGYDLYSLGADGIEGGENFDADIKSSEY